MKKIVGILAAAAVATSAFAVDFTAGVNAKMGWTSSGYGWLEDHVGTDDLLDVTATTDVAGANFNIRAKEAAADGHDARGLFLDAYNVWVKPVSALKLTMGTGADFSIFGDGIGKGDGKIGVINDGTGVKGEVTAMNDALWIGARVGAGNKFINDIDKQLKFEVGASYKIDGFGKIGAEFAREGNNGAAASDGTNEKNYKDRNVVDYKWNAFMVGADITAVENMEFIVDVAGAFLNKDACTDGSAWKIGAFAKMKFNALTVNLSNRAIIRTGDLGDKDKRPNCENFTDIVCAYVSYDINAFKPYVSFAYAMNDSATSDQYKGKFNTSDTESIVINGSKTNQMAITAGCEYTCGAAVVSAEYTYNYSKADGADANDSWEIPVKFKYTF